MKGVIVGSETEMAWVDAETPIAPVVDERLMPLHSLVLRLPGTQISINGEPYEIEVDEDLITHSVNVAHAVPSEVTEDEQRLRYPIDEITITLHDGLPAPLADEPTYAPPLLYDGRKSAVEFSVPREVVSSSMSHEELVAQFNNALNSQLEIGLLQNAILRYKAYNERYRRFCTNVAGPLVGMLTAVSFLPDQAGKVSTLLERGSLGTAAGVAAAIISTKLKETVLPDTFNRQSKRVPRRALYVQKKPASFRYARRVLAAARKNPFQLMPVELFEPEDLDTAS